jgi:hypothetical protein
MSGAFTRDTVRTGDEPFDAGFVLSGHDQQAIVAFFDQPLRERLSATASQTLHVQLYVVRPHGAS